VANRYAAVLARPGTGVAGVAGVDPARLAAAMLEDVCELVAELVGASAALILCPPGWLADLELPVWPGTVVLGVPAMGEEASETHSAFGALAAAGADEAVLVAADAPDLPRLLIGKVFSGLQHADAGVVPAAGGGLVALGCRLPAAGWLEAAGAGLDTADALARLQQAAPRRRSLAVVSGWHRVRRPGDVARLDPGLEGWAATRALLGR
jgi:glycosyltransferase A (GT-A) superfamily protein (DUF2064 family)